jgi:hypothetical protein
MFQVRKKVASAMAAAALALGVAATLPAAAATASPARPAAAAEAALCSGHSFLWMDGAHPHCLQTTGTYVVAGQGPYGTFVNNTGDRVWLHQNADSSGWAVCLGHGMAYVTAGGTAYENPGNVQITTNNATCGPGTDTLISYACQQFGAMAYLEAEADATGFCYYEDSYTTINGTKSVLTNATGYRVWLHQYSDGTGWADCFNTNSVYDLAGTRDASAGQIYVSTNNAAC